MFSSSWAVGSSAHTAEWFALNALESAMLGFHCTCASALSKGFLSNSPPFLRNFSIVAGSTSNPGDHAAHSKPCT